MVWPVVDACVLLLLEHNFLDCATDETGNANSEESEQKNHNTKTYELFHNLCILGS